MYVFASLSHTLYTPPHSTTQTYNGTAPIAPLPSYATRVHNTNYGTTLVHSCPSYTHAPSYPQYSSCDSAYSNWANPSHAQAPGQQWPCASGGCYAVFVAAGPVYECHVGWVRWMSCIWIWVGRRLRGNLRGRSSRSSLRMSPRRHDNGICESGRPLQTGKRYGTLKIIVENGDNWRCVIQIYFLC